MRPDELVLDLGCGLDKVPGAIGMDRASLPTVDVIYDLERTPYPFQDNSFQELHMYHVLEHVNEPVQVLDEVWRISRPGAIVNIRVPHSSSFYAWVDPTHKRPFSYFSFDYLTEAHAYGYYSVARFEIVHRRLVYFMAAYRDQKVDWKRKPLLAVGRMIEFVANAAPLAAERLWAYWVGGFEEIHVTLRVVK